MNSNFDSESDDYHNHNLIPVIVYADRPAKPCVSPQKTANRVIRFQCKKVYTATQLPVIVNLNPRSVYNKKKEFKDMMNQLDVDICCMSESWDRKDKGLEKFIQMDGYQIVKNVLQRDGKGGKPALIIKKDKYFVKELCPDIITVPPTVEASWALLTPKIKVNNEVKHIAVASVYYANRTKRKAFIDHICETYNLLLAKYGQGLHFIIAGDFNRLNINPILDLSSTLSQVVQIPTRRNPDVILDTIINTLSKYFLSPLLYSSLKNLNLRRQL
jgi:exonuclease III